MVNPLDFLEELKNYFENTSDEQIQIDWDKTQEFDQIGNTWSILDSNFDQVFEKE